jgi:4-hydroxy-2-oxoheptanedioate aldolase
VSALLRARIAAGHGLVGTVLTLPGATAAELASEPFDLVWIDLEHAALGRHEAQELILGAQAAHTAALVRVPATDHATTAAMLDAGADGIVLASVDDGREAVAAFAASRHPPHGTRGYGPRRAGLRGRSGGAAAARPSLWAQIETRSGVEHAAQIAAVDGIDALVVGTADLSFALGVALDLGAPELVDAVAAVRRAARGAATPTAFGLAGGLLDAPPALIAGTQLLVHSTDARLLASAVDGAAARLRALGPSSAFDSDPRETSTR